MNEYEDFVNAIKNIINSIIDEKLQKENLYVSHPCTVTAINNESTPYLQKCSVDLFFTQINNVSNKSGEMLNVGDNVILMERYNSKLSNCYISVKNN